METKIAVLRGINVGGKRKIPMAELRLLAENLNLKKVRTYIQSGNLIFQADQSESELEMILEREITHTFGFDVPVIVRDLVSFRKLTKSNPFLTTDPDTAKLHVTLLKQEPSADAKSKITAFSSTKDKFAFSQRAVFIYCEGKYHQSKLSNTFFEKKLQVGATTRNWKTILKLTALASEYD